jgi:hypothetical protein
MEALHNHLTHFECHDFIAIKIATFLLISINAIDTRETMLAAAIASFVAS